MTVLAAELVHSIIDYLQDDVKALKACACTSRVWSSRSRYHLFRTLSVNVGRQWEFFGLLVLSDIVLQTIIPLRVLVQDLVVSARHHQQPVPEESGVPSFSVTIQAFHHLLHSFPYLESLQLKSVNILSLEPHWSPDDLPVPPRHLRSLDLSGTNSPPDDLLRVLRMFSSIKILCLNAHIVHWFPDRRTLQAALVHPSLSSTLLPGSLQVSELCLKDNVGWAAAMCLRIGPSLNLEHLQVVPHQLPIDMPAIGALLAATALGPGLRRLSVFFDALSVRWNGSAGT